MMEFLAANFNLPTIIVGAIVFGGVGWITWRLQWQLQRLQRLSLSIEMIRKGRGLEHSARALFSETKS